MQTVHDAAPTTTTAPDCMGSLNEKPMLCLATTAQFQQLLYKLSKDKHSQEHYSLKVYNYTLIKIGTKGVLANSMPTFPSSCLH